jgi:hypothetical protein
LVDYLLEGGAKSASSEENNSQIYRRGSLNMSAQVKPGHKETSNNWLKCLKHLFYSSKKLKKLFLNVFCKKNGFEGLGSKDLCLDDDHDGRRAWAHKKGLNV